MWATFLSRVVIRGSFPCKLGRLAWRESPFCECVLAVVAPLSSASTRSPVSALMLRESPALAECVALVLEAIEAGGEALREGCR